MLLRCTTAIALMLAACGHSTAPRSATTEKLAIRDVRVFDGTRTLEHQTVLVDHGRVVALGDAATLAVPAGARVIEGSGETLLPGLIDAHTHVSNADELRTALAFGVTTELDMYSDPKDTVPLARDPDALDRARLVTAGFGATVPKGHGTEYGGDPVPTLTKPEEAEAFVAARVAEGSQYLKIIIESGSPRHPWPTLDAPTVRALVAAAHAHKLLAITHVGSATDVATGMAGEVDAFAHTVPEPLDAATIAEIKKRNMFVVATLEQLSAACGRDTGPQLVNDPDLRRLEDAATIEQLKTGYSKGSGDCDGPGRNVKAMHDAGIPILAGTDAPNPGTAHGPTLHGELALLVAAGLTPTEALAAATSVPAAKFSLADLGVIRPGAIADLVLVEGDPTRDITATRKLRAVWRGGRAVDLEARIKSIK